MKKTITAKYTDEIELLTFFAIEKGWTAKVPNPEPMPIDGTDWVAEIDNTVTVEEFLKDWANNTLRELIGQPAKNYVREQFNVQCKKELDRIDNELAQKLEITVE